MHRLLGICLGLSATGVAAFLVALESPLLESLRLRAFDHQHRYALRWFPQDATPRASPPILHVDIDDRSIRAVGPFPWRRDLYAKALDVLSEFGAHAVVLDIEFDRPSHPRLDRLSFARNLSGILFVPLAQALQSALAAASSGGTADLESPTARTRLAETVLREAQSEILQRVGLEVQDDDESLARAISRSGKVVLAYHYEPIPESLRRMSDRVAEAREVIRKNFRIAPDSLAEQTGIPLEALEGNFATLQRHAISDGFSRMLEQNPELSDEEAIGQISAGLTRPLDRHERELLEDLLDRARALRRLGVSSQTTTNHSDWVQPPLGKFLAAARGAGFVNTDPDPDGITRAASLVYSQNDVRLPSIAFAVYRDVRQRASPTAALVHVPLDASGRFVIFWRSFDWSPAEPFEHLPIHTLLQYWTLSREMETELDELAPLAGRDPFLGERERQRRAAKTPEEFRANSLEHQETQAALGELETALRENLEHLERQLPLLPEGTEGRTFVEQRLASLRERAEKLDAWKRLRETLHAKLENRICFIGVTATSGGDLRPIPHNGSYPGVGIHSHVLGNLLEERFLRVASRGANVGVTVLLGLAATLLAVRGRPVLNLVASVLLLAAFDLGSVYALGRAAVVIDPVGPNLAMLLSLLVILSYRELTEERTKRWVRQVFEHYLMPSVVSELLKDPRSLRLGRGTRQTATAFFSDLEGFTTISEQLDPVDVVAVLNQYHTVMTDVIVKHGGLLDKFDGDGIVAVFGVPKEFPEHARAACLAALEAGEEVRGLHRVHEILERGAIANLRIGLASGEMIAGNVGSKSRLNYTVIGDTVNLAARLEQANKLFGTRLLASERTREVAGEAIVAREIALFRVKGKAQGTRLYEILGPAGNVAPEHLELARRFDQGLSAFRAREFTQAEAIFAALAVENPQDKPAHIYRKLCQRFLAEPPDPAWDGVLDPTMVG